MVSSSGWAMREGARDGQGEKGRGVGRASMEGEQEMVGWAGPVFRNENKIRTRSIIQI